MARGQRWFVNLGEVTDCSRSAGSARRFRRRARPLSRSETSGIAHSFHPRSLDRPEALAQIFGHAGGMSFKSLRSYMTHSASNLWRAGLGVQHIFKTGLPPAPGRTGAVLVERVALLRDPPFPGD